MTEDLQPFVLYRLNSGAAECAFWQLREGPRALALFQSAGAAALYQSAAGLGAEWQAYRPAREGLLHLLQACAASGIRHAVLDPDREKAKLIFDLNDILAAVARVPPGPPQVTS